MNYEITKIPHYPDDGKHLEINLDFGVTIYLGRDIIYYTDQKGKEVKTDTKHWWVMPNHDYISRPKKFKEHHDAVMYARQRYMIWCKKEASRMMVAIKGMNTL